MTLLGRMSHSLLVLCLGCAAFVATTATIADTAHRRKPSDLHVRGGASGWICNAYGRGGKRNTWEMVTGARMTSLVAAKASALRECSKKRVGCSPSGCWPE